MPGKNSDANGDKPIPSFVKYRMSDEEMADFQSNQTMDEDGIFQFMCWCIDNRVKFSASYDAYGGGCQAFLTPGKPEDKNFGLTLSARAPDLLNAVSLLHYKHFVLFKQEWPKDGGQRGSVWG